MQWECGSWWSAQGAWAIAKVTKIQPLSRPHRQFFQYILTILRFPDPARQYQPDRVHTRELQTPGIDDITLANYDAKGIGLAGHTDRA